MILLLLFTVGSAPSILAQRSTVDLSVRVTSRQQHEQQLEQARVELLRFPAGIIQMTFTDASGRAQFNNIRPDSYTVRASKAGYQTDEVRVDFRRGDTFQQVHMQLRPEEHWRPTAPEAVISSRALSIPESAQNEFRKGAQLLRDKKEAKESIVCFDKAIEIFPNYQEAYFLKDVAHLQLNALNDAQASLAKAIDLDPKFLEPYHPLAIALFTLKRYPEAEKVLLQAMEQDKNGWQWPFELARCYAAEGQWEKALTYGRTANTRPNTPSKVHLLMADLYSNTGSVEKAIEEIETFEKLDPKSPLMPRAQQALEQLRKQKHR